MGAKRLSLLAMLVALCFVLAWLESQIPAFIAVPGVKLGLTNLVVLTALYKLDWKQAMLINIIRIVLIGITFGNLFSMWYALAGGMLSTAGMIFFKNVVKARIVTVSVVGGLLHNLGQIIVAMIVLETSSLMYYLVILWVSGAVAGTIIGLLGAAVVSRLKKID
ncbi:MAG: Gx transporter family protein [Eubacterium sp.]|nr:Gx transporter family protein [Eubacterium sp.]